MRINEDLEANLPGEVDSVLNLKQDQYIMTVYTGKYLNSVYMIQFTNKAGFNINDEDDYADVLKGVHKGIANTFRKKKLVPIVTDTTLHGIHMKGIEVDDPGLGNGMRWNTYVFIANDRLYNVGVIQPMEEHAMEEDIQTFLNSMHFTNAIREKNLPTAAYNFGYKIGYLSAMLLAAGAFGFFIYYIVRRSRRI